VREDTPPELLVAEQVEGREAPCSLFRLGDPARIEERCRTPVVRGPCAPPFACQRLTADGKASYPRRLTKSRVLGGVERVIIRNGGAHCGAKGTLSAVPVGGFGAGFVGRFEIAEPGSFRGTSGAISKVTVEEAGSGYQLPPQLVISGGGAGCQGVELEAVLSSEQFHGITVFPGIGLDLHVIARDASWDAISSLIASGHATTGAEGTTLHPGYTEQHTGLPPALARAVLHPPQIMEGGSIMARRLRWVPLRSLGGSHAILVCFKAEDASGTTSASNNVLVPNKHAAGCMAVTVERCRYAVRPGETMTSIAAFYSTNWLQLWSLNTEIVNPDGVLVEGSVVNVGHTYVVAEGDVIDWVVRKFGSSRPQILAYNQDVATYSADTIGPGQPLCVIPNSCSTHV